MTSPFLVADGALSLFLTSLPRRGLLNHSLSFFSVSRLSNTSMMKFGQRANESLLSILSYRASLFLKLFVWRDICTHIVLQRLRTSAVLDMCVQSLNRTFQFLYDRSYGGIKTSESPSETVRGFLLSCGKGPLVSLLLLRLQVLLKRLPHLQTNYCAVQIHFRVCIISELVKDQTEKGNKTSTNSKLDPREMAMRPGLTLPCDFIERSF